MLIDTANKKKTTSLPNPGLVVLQPFDLNRQQIYSARFIFLSNTSVQMYVFKVITIFPQNGIQIKKVSFFCQVYIISDILILEEEFIMGNCALAM